ncbi:TcaA NTF2-like domain-containing protein, partial [Priestia megaterium]
TIIITVVSSILLSACQQEETLKDGNTMIVEKDAKKVLNEPKTQVESIQSIDLNKEAMSGKFITAWMTDYFSAFGKAVDQNSFDDLKVFLKADSSFYKEQILLVENFTRQGIEQKKQTFHIVNWYEEPNHVFKIQTHEESLLKQPGKDPYTKICDRLYTAVYQNDTLKLSSVEPFDFSSKPNASTETPTTQTTDLHDYDGKWTTGNDNGSPIIQFLATSNSEATIKINSYQPPSKIRVSTVEQKNIRFENNQAAIEYENDGQGNKGTIVITLKENSISLLAKTDQNKKAKWGIPSGDYVLDTFEN